MSLGLASKHVSLARAHDAWAAAFASERTRIHEVVGHGGGSLGRLEAGFEIRDLLRAQPALAGEYAREKERLAQQYAYDREAYQREKGKVIERILSNAGAQSTQP